MRYKFVLAAVDFSISIGANAQLIFIPPYNPGLQLLNDSIKGNPNQISEEDEDTRSSTPSIQPSTVNFLYTPSKARTRQNLAAFAAKARSVDPTGAAQMEQLFANTDIIGEIDKAMRPMGLRADNVADAYAVWWVASWEAVNQKDAGDSASIYGAVKKQVENALGATPQFASASDTLKQEMAESLLIQAAMIDAHRDAAAGDPSQQAALAKAVNQGAKQMELDLTKLDLTENGFVAR